MYFFLLVAYFSFRSRIFTYDHWETNCFLATFGYTFLWNLWNLQIKWVSLHVWVVIGMIKNTENVSYCTVGLNKWRVTIRMKFAQVNLSINYRHLLAVWKASWNLHKGVVAAGDLISIFVSCERFSNRMPWMHENLWIFANGRNRFMSEQFVVHWMCVFLLCYLLCRTFGILNLHSGHRLLWVQSLDTSLRSPERLQVVSRGTYVYCKTWWLLALSSTLGLSGGFRVTTRLQITCQVFAPMYLSLWLHN